MSGNQHDTTIKYNEDSGRYVRDCTCPDTNPVEHLTYKSAFTAGFKHWDAFIPLDRIEYELWRTTRYGIRLPCDRKCGATRFPITLEQYAAAVQHWRFHSRDGGCSHGRR